MHTCIRSRHTIESVFWGVRATISNIEKPHTTQIWHSLHLPALYRISYSDYSGRRRSPATVCVFVTVRAVLIDTHPTISPRFCFRMNPTTLPSWPLVCLSSADETTTTEVIAGKNVVIGTWCVCVFVYDCDSPCRRNAGSVVDICTCIHRWKHQ